MPDTALVTGGAGFIGSRLVHDLIAKGNRVIVLDNFEFGRRENLHQSKHLKSIKGDLRSLEILKLRELLSHYSVGKIFHLAALHFIPYCEAYPLKTIETNIEGTRRILEAAVESPVECFVFASTGDIYASSNHKLTESALVAPSNIYGYTKWCGEQLVDMFHRRVKRIRFSIARLFNAYGTHETNPHVIPHIVEQLRKGRTIALGNLSPRRDFLHVEDASRALLAMSRLRSQFSIYNVARGQAYSVADLVRIFSCLIGHKLEVSTNPDLVRGMDRPVLIGDSSKLQRASGWRPRIDIEAGLRDLVMREGLV